MDYHNEFDPYAADWLENLIDFGVLPPGKVDRRSIADVKPGDLKGFTRCHFFAGIGGWAYALDLAGWPVDRPVWTGSCPCQPFSNAGKRKGAADERHLWPEFNRLIAECAPPTVFGEQVASKDGRAWLAGVRADLEALGYGVGAADLCAAGAGAPHIRQRLYWLADAMPAGRAEWRASTGSGSVAGSGGAGGQHGQQPQDGGVGGLAFSDEGQWRPRRSTPEPTNRPQPEPAGRGAVAPIDGLGDTSSARSGRDAGAVPGAQGEGGGERCVAGRFVDESVDAGAACRLGDTHDARPQGRLDGSGEGGRADQRPARPAGESGGFWSRYDVVHCTDGKARRFEPGSFPLAHGVSNRVGRLRGYGNAIVPQVAAEFVSACMDLS